jgi:hypothetical protein
MKNPEPIPIHQLIQRLIEQSPHQHKMMEASIINAWHQLMPALVNKRTKRIYIKQYKIFVEITSSPLRHELQNAKQTILERLQAHVPGYRVDDIVFIA